MRSAGKKSLMVGQTLGMEKVATVDTRGHCSRLMSLSNSLLKPTWEMLVKEQSGKSQTRLLMGINSLFSCLFFNVQYPCGSSH